mmetsp:Transcript_22245/g.50725  ORF Transcript_22245/g.50725 Transcript_22245/m.50725 type:complete len:90 (-) Transcript_22245:8-277(-)
MRRLVSTRVATGGELALDGFVCASQPPFYRRAVVGRGGVWSRVCVFWASTRGYRGGVGGGCRFLCGEGQFKELLAVVNSSRTMVLVFLN